MASGDEAAKMAKCVSDKVADIAVFKSTSECSGPTTLTSKKELPFDIAGDTITCSAVPTASPTPIPTIVSSKSYLTSRALHRHPYLQYVSTRPTAKPSVAPPASKALSQGDIICIVIVVPSHICPHMMYSCDAHIYLLTHPDFGIDCCCTVHSCLPDLVEWADLRWFCAWWHSDLEAVRPQAGASR